jgi:hypothetical protein
MKGIVYSANIGAGKLAKYDWTEPHSQPEPGVLFSHVSGVCDSRREARYQSRIVKISEPPKIVANGWCVWLDASMRLQRPIADKIDEWFQPNEQGHPQLIVVKHPWRNCAYDEIDECVRLKKVTEEEGESAKRVLLQRGHPKQYGLWSLGFIAFRHLMFDLRMRWWELYQYAPRDQFWLPTVVRELGTKIKVLDMNIYDNKYWNYKTHGT